MSDALAASRVPVRVARDGLVFLMLGIGLACAMIAGLAAGTRPLSLATVVNAVAAFDAGNFDHVALWRFRLPRLLGGAVTGAALAVTGAMLQSLSRNPLAEPQLLGLNAGAALAVVALSFFGPASYDVFRPLVAAAGAFAAFAIVLGLSNMGRGGATPLKLILCGVVVSAFASALTSSMLLLDDQTLEDIRLWLSGDLGGQNFAELRLVSPIIVVGTAAALALASRLDVLALGDAAASGLGIKTGRIRLFTLLACALLTGCAVTLAGPIGCIGLIVPHLMRRLFGSNLRRVIAGSVLAGAGLLVLADALARTILAPIEISTGVVTGALGATIFIILIARYFR